MYSISYQITKLLVFLIMAWNQLVVVFLRKQLMDMTNSSYRLVWTVIITQNLSHWDPKSISVFGVDRFRFRQFIY